MKHYKYIQGNIKFWIFKLSWAFLHTKWTVRFDIGKGWDES